jgi:hypothetical protein
MKKLIYAGLILVVCGLAVFAQQTPKREVPQTANAPAAAVSSSVSTNQTKADDQYIVIGYLEKRGRTITIKSGPHGPAYTVATKDGKVLFENVSAEQLKAQAPELHQLIKTGLANDARVGLSQVKPSNDASLLK